ncbi:MAG: mechanosensitive ion channel family protein [Hyphomicrobium sp.]|nr:mechanosensitive ion channel family protein [Hyphomicrobium sp.]
MTTPVERLVKGIESAEKSIQQLKELESELQRLRTDVEEIIYDSTATAETLRPKLTEVKSQIERLGPAPKDQPEAPAIAAERARLNTIAAALDGAVKSVELTWVRGKQMIDRITVMRYQIFSRNLFERRASPLLPSLWHDVYERLPSITGRAQYYGAHWFERSSRQWLALIGVIAGALAAAFLISRFVDHWIEKKRAGFEGIPSFFDRINQAAIVAPARMLGPMIAAAILYAGFDSLDMFFSPWERLSETVLWGVLIYIAGSGMARVTLAPRHPEWRLIPVDDDTASFILTIVKAILGVYILDTVLVEFGRAIYVPLAVTVAQGFITNLLTAGLLALLALKPFVAQTGPLRVVNHLDRVDANAGKRLAPLSIKLPILALAIFIAGSSTVGYVALGRYVAQQIVLTGTVLAIAGLIYLGVRALTRRREGANSAVGAFLESRFGIERTRQSQIVKLCEAAVLLALLFAALPLLMMQWGFSGADIRDWAKALFFGFEIGLFRISLIRILIGIILFIALLFLTRITQRWLREHVLAQDRMDAGVANSVDLAVGYVGVSVAVLMAVSYAGLDVTNLAIVAGALSVGIGFGLQSVVNNFVSGLILLAERPIKVGDWIVVGDQQGNVRRISVRSTEIETFDRASLIVPNSELISGRVLNWTHRNMLGRVVIKVSTDMKASPKAVIEILEQVARGQPNVQEKPPPLAVLETFTPDSLMFSLSFTLSNVNAGGRVKSELHIAILDAFREAGIYATLH